MTNDEKFEVLNMTMYFKNNEKDEVSSLSEDLQLTSINRKILA